jgi:Rrf2 family protein
MKVSKKAAYALHALMYMVRHATQLPVATNVIAKAEGIPPAYLAKVFHTLVKAGLVKVARGRNIGYVFARPPEEINLLELLEIIEGGPLFDDCFLNHCLCGGTAENCYIYSRWISATKKLSQLLEETSVTTATWNHPEHRFYSLPESLRNTTHKKK